MEKATEEFEFAEETKEDKIAAAEAGSVPKKEEIGEEIGEGIGGVEQVSAIMTGVDRDILVVMR